jgi:glucose/arabinose dehydrogenase
MSLPRRRFLTVSAGLLIGGGLAGCSGADNAPNPVTLTAGPDSPTAAPSSASAAPSTSAGSNAPSASPTRALGKPEARDLVTGLTTPWAIVALKDKSLLVCERDTALIKRVVGSKATELRRISEVEPGGEGGLLGLAISADEKTVFGYFTAADDNRIVAMAWDGKRLGDPRSILTGIPKGFRHNGGRMLVGPDDLLYVGTGEVGDTSLAQDKKSLAGKILRLTQDGKPAKDNPFDNEVYSYGHRNVQGLAFDDANRLWASEFGDQTWDELNLITKGGNYGWPQAEGSGGADGLVNPKLVWRTEDASPSGLAFWQGELWMAALRGERLWEIPLRGTDPGDPVAHFADDYGRLRSVTVAADGRSLLLTGSNTDGRADPGSDDDRLVRVTR